MTYILIQITPPGLTNEKRQQAHDGIRYGMGKQNAPSPHQVTHSKANTDNSVWLFEAEFTNDELQRAAIVSVIAEATGSNESAIDAIMEYDELTDAEAKIVTVDMDNGVYD